MKKLKIFLCLYACFPAFCLLAEDMPTMPVAYFAVKCSEIWEAEPLEQNAVASIFWKVDDEDWDWFRVRISKVHRSNFYKAGDTVYVTLGTVYAWPKLSESDAERRLSARDTIRRLFLFGHMVTQMEHNSYSSWPPAMGRGSYLQIESSGIRPENQQGKVFTPIQMGNPGPYSFYRSNGTGAEWRACVERHVQLANELFALRRIENRGVQNDSLFSWIRRNKASLTLPNHDDRDSWIWHRELPFSWILNNGEDEKAWEAIVLYHQFFPDDMLYNSDYYYSLSAQQNHFEQSQVKLRPFHSQKGIDFILEKMRDTSLSIPLRNHALSRFRDALHGNLTLEDRKTILRGLLQMFENDSLLNRYEWVETIQSVGFWQENEQERSLQEAYQFMVYAYQKEPPEAYKGIFADFLVRKSTAEEWKKLNGSDARILVQLQNFQVDTFKSTIIFRIHQDYGYEQIFDCPQMEMFQLDAIGQRLWERTLSESDFCSKVEWSKQPLNGELCVKIQLDESTTPRGRLYFRAWGNAGQKHEFRWISELGTCHY